METNLCVAGFGGQGIMSLGKILADATCHSTDKKVTFFPSYGAEQRGGTANCYVVISDEEIGAPLGDVMDDVIVMNGASLAKFLPKVRPGGRLFVNSSIARDPVDRTDITVVKAPVTEMALALGSPKVLNVIMLGVYLGFTQVIAPFLEAKGVTVHYEEQFMDAPTTVGGPEVYLRREDCWCVLDVGGDSVGARSVGQYAPRFRSAQTAVYYVINPYRPWSDTTVRIDAVLSEILSVTHLSIEDLRLVGNPNLGPSTTECRTCCRRSPWC